jgi:CubicO group peptidase (beta-lactamase class C family)
MDFHAWHNEPLSAHLNLTSQYVDQGYGFISLSVYGATSAPYYAAVVVRPAPALQHYYAAVPGSQWQQTFNSEAAQGFGPVIIAATGPASGPIFAAVFEPQNPLPWTVNGLAAGDDPWNLQQINNSGQTSGPAALDDLFVSVYNNQQHFVYRDAKGNIQDAWYGGGGWQLQHINNGGMTQGPPAAGDLFVSVYNNQQHFAYRDAGGSIQDAWYGNGGWHLQRVNQGVTIINEPTMTNGPAAALHGLFVSVYVNQQHFCYLDPGGTIWDAFYDGSAWHLQKINNGGQTNGPPAVGDLFVSVYNNQQHFSYRDAGGNIQDAWYGSGGWNLQRINNGSPLDAYEYTATDGPPATGGLFVSVYVNQQHFSYLDAGGTIWDPLFDGHAWHIQKINNGGQTNGPAAVGDLFVCVYGAQQHFCYRDAGGGVQDAFYGPGGWSFQTVNNNGMTTGVSAVSNLFVCDYNNQQHFSYFDSSNNIQDAYFSGGPMTFQGVCAQAKSRGLILRWAAAYGDSSAQVFAGIWVANTALTQWNCDGVLDSADYYQGRFAAETSAWCRPAFVTLNSSRRYLSFFVDDQIGAYYANHVMTPAQYQSAFNTWRQQGFYPICVQGAGPDANSATISAIFAKSQQVISKPFSATGPVTNDAIDAVIWQYMQSYGVRDAALAIVNGKQLVYARGYTLAEPGWPATQPVTCFRLASVSKTVTALVVFQLIDQGLLHLTDTVQGILQLRTPSGGQPVDSRFNAITIQQLVEHYSGLNPDAFSNSIAVQQAFKGSNLPVTPAMTNAYIASLNLQHNPGQTQVYSNCGYYLLSQVAAKLRGQSSAMAAYQYLFRDLSITRIRESVSLLPAQPADEARYQDWNIPVAASVMSNARPLVPAGYGDANMEIGNVSGAATDIARLIAILISESDNPAMTRQTLVNMLQAAVQVKLNNPRAGYGFDDVSIPGDNQFYAQKGGSENSCASVLQFTGDWGFTMLWGNGRPGSSIPGGLVWYPDFKAVMNIATKFNWGPADLFPQFGMPSL